MKKILWLLYICMSLPMSAQTQQGFVKSIGRPNKPGVALGNVTIRTRGMVNAVVSSSTGEFRIHAPNKKDGDAITLLSIHKKGFELKDRGLIGRSLVFSSRVPIEITMIDSRQLAIDKKRIEDNAYKKAEQNFQKKIQEIEEQKRKNEITIEKYQLELKSLQQKYEKYISLISDMADRYARTDYDQLDSIDQEINVCIENGELEIADSLIHTVFDPETVLERNRAAKEEIRQRIAFAQSIIDKARADKEAIMRDMEYAKRVIDLCEKLAQEYAIQEEHDKAIGCLENSLEIKRILYGEESTEVNETIKQINFIKNEKQ